MTWTVNIGGHDDLEAEAKEAFENGLVAKVKQWIEDIRENGVTISNANVTTNTTGSVDVLAQDAPDDAAPADDGGEEPAPA